MPKYAAFIRGINVGGRIIKMADLRAHLTELGLKQVQTILQSGNVIFSSALKNSALKKKIETGLAKRFDFPAKVQIYTIAKLQSLVDSYPFATNGTDQHNYIIFIENGLEKALVKETYALAKNEQVKAGKGVVYWNVNKGATLKTSFAKLLTKSAYKAFNTNRNLRTLNKLLLLAQTS